MSKKLLFVLLLVTGIAFLIGSSFTQQRREMRALRDTNDSVHEIRVADLKRSYVLHVPVGLDAKKPVPLVLVFHGGGGHAWSMPKFTGFDAVADRNGFIVAYPDSLNQHWSDGRGLSPADDVGFIRALIAELEHSYPVEPNRIYAAGISNGGFFSNRLACDLADQIAAIASVAATMPELLTPVCHPARPISVLYMHGTKDPLVPIDGGMVARKNGKCISLAASVEFWRKIDHTDGQAQEEDLPAREEDGTTVHRQIWKDGKQGSEVVAYTIAGGGHTWPGGSQYAPVVFVGKVSHQLDATATIWEFFSRHSL